MLETPIAQPSPAPSGKEKSPYQADRLRGVKEARTAIEVLKAKWPAIFNDPKTIKPLASSVLSQVAAALGWSLGYTRGVFHVWKSRNDYCRAVLRFRPRPSRRLAKRGGCRRPSPRNGESSTRHECRAQRRETRPRIGRDDRQEPGISAAVTPKKVSLGRRARRRNSDGQGGRA